MVQENSSAYFFMVKYKNGMLVCDADRVDLDSPVRQEVNKRMELANRVLGIIRGHYPNATDIYIEITSDDSKNTAGFVNDGTPINIIWRKWIDEYYLVYLSEIDEVTRKFIDQYPAYNAPMIDCYPHVAAIPIIVIEAFSDIMTTITNVWHALTNNN